MKYGIKTKRMNLQQIIQKRHFIIEKSQRSTKNKNIIEHAQNQQTKPKTSSLIFQFLNSGGVENESIRQSNSSNLRESDNTTVKKLQKQKMKNLRKFTIFEILDKNLQNYSHLFQQIEYSREQCIYHTNQPTKGVYFILEGHVIASIYKQNCVQNQITSSLNFNVFKRKKTILQRVDIYKLFEGNYFGQKQIIQGSNRVQTVRCDSAKCVLIFVSTQNFNRICLKNDDFYKQIKKQSQLKKIIHQKSQMRSTSTLKNIFPLKNSFFGNKNYEQSNKFVNINQNQNQNYKQDKGIRSTSLSASVLKKRKLKILHGNQIKSYQSIQLQSKLKQKLKVKQSQLGFKMLEADAQLYKQTQKKFRKYSYLRKYSKTKRSKTEMNEPGKQSLSSRSLKTLWNLLNLDRLVDEQTKNYANQQGKKYFYQHQRMKRHLTETKSTKPPLSSCSLFKRKSRVISQLIG